MGISMKKKTRSADICADQIDVITNFAVIKNVVIKRVHCILMMNKDTRIFTYALRLAQFPTN